MWSLKCLHLESEFLQLEYLSFKGLGSLLFPLILLVYHDKYYCNQSTHILSIIVVFVKCKFNVIFKYFESSKIIIFSTLSLDVLQNSPYIVIKKERERNVNICFTLTYDVNSPPLVHVRSLYNHISMKGLNFMSKSYYRVIV